MTQKLDYSREDAMEILNNVNFSDEEKRSQYEEYMSELKKTRKNAIVTKLNDLAREIPTITKDIYISVLKKYENDDLSIPFEVIESELSTFEKDMRKKYDEYLESNIKGIYPCGEGAGYAGGITTSAMDGIKVSEAIIEKYEVYNEK